MLRLLGESEAAIRRSVNPRLVVETLLLRWTMMDRTVDLAEVLGQADRRSGGQANRSASPGAGPVARVGAATDPSRGGQGTRGGLSGSARPGMDPLPVRPTDRLPADLQSLQSAWPEIVAQIRERSRFLGEALAATTPTALELPWLTVALAEPNPLFAERIQGQAGTVEEVLQRATGAALRLRVTEAVPSSGEAARPRGMSEASIKADRLKAFRAKDPALDTAAEALDLEIVE
jgi:DNA polymerase-3 subunit gamma/tau